MRKLYLESEKPFELVDVEYIVEPTLWEALMKFLGFSVEPRVGIRKEKRRGSRRWRWQTHTEVEEESGVVRHEEFFDDDNDD
jgi:hypothetical protein